jgi:hypothetical protein
MSYKAYTIALLSSAIVWTLLIATVKFSYEEIIATGRAASDAVQGPTCEFLPARPRTTSLQPPCRPKMPPQG